MAHKAPGKHFRKGMTLVEAVQAFTDEEAVERLFVNTRWPNGVVCPKCESENIQERATRKPQPFRCRDCRKDFSVKTGTVMQGSNLPLSKWAMAIYLMSTSLKGVSSMKLHRDIGVTQKSAWHLTHRIRKAWETNGSLFAGPVEADETFIGGKEKNKHQSKRIKSRRGTVGKTPLAGVKDRATNQVSTQVVPDTRKPTLQSFVEERTESDTQVYTDESVSYVGIDRPHNAVRHSTGEYVRDMVHTNGIESHWAMLKRGIVGTYHHISPKHLDRYAAEFEGRHNSQPTDTIDQIQGVIAGMDGKQLKYQDLIAE